MMKKLLPNNLLTRFQERQDSLLEGFHPLFLLPIILEISTLELQTYYIFLCDVVNTSSNPLNRSLCTPSIYTSFSF